MKVELIGKKAEFEPITLKVTIDLEDEREGFEVVSEHMTRAYIQSKCYCDYEKANAFLNVIEEMYQVMELRG